MGKKQHHSEVSTSTSTPSSGSTSSFFTRVQEGVDRKVREHGDIQQSLGRKAVLFEAYLSTRPSGRICKIERGDVAILGILSSIANLSSSNGLTDKEWGRIAGFALCGNECVYGE